MPKAKRNEEITIEAKDRTRTKRRRSRLLKFMAKKNGFRYPMFLMPYSIHLYPLEGEVGGSLVAGERETAVVAMYLMGALEEKSKLPILQIML